MSVLLTKFYVSSVEDGSSKSKSAVRSRHFEISVDLCAKSNMYARYKLVSVVFGIFEMFAPSFGMFVRMIASSRHGFLQDRGTGADSPGLQDQLMLVILRAIHASM